MKMNKCLVFVLIFFLVFSFYLKQVKAGAATADDSYGTWDSSDYQYGGTTSEGTVQAPGETLGQVSNSVSQFSIQLISMAFQLFGIVILTILLIVVVEELVKSKA